ncbi:MAG: hypothetical protein QXT45_05970 [Candidatus Bilamarchaeaceae archaeon]
MNPFIQDFGASQLRDPTKSRNPYLAPYNPFNLPAESGLYMPQSGLMNLFGGTQNPFYQLLINAYVVPAISRFLGPGYMPAMVSSPQNYYDFLRSTLEFREKQRAAQLMSPHDISTITDIQRGFYEMLDPGIWDRNPELARLARERSAQIMAMAPILSSMMPETWDMLFGAKGSAFLYSQRMHDATRTIYDPFTGRFGLSGSTLAKISSSVYSNLYGTEEATERMLGIGAGRAGILGQEMVARGLLYSPRGIESMIRDEIVSGRMDRDFALRAKLRGALASSFGDEFAENAMTQEGLGRLAKDLKALAEVAKDPAIKEWATNEIGKKIANNIREMNSAVVAMRDALGTRGIAGVSTGQIMDIISDIVGGKMAYFSGSRLEDIIRTVDVASRLGNVRLDIFQSLNRNVADALSKVGLDRSLAHSITTRSVLMGASYADISGGIPAFGMLDKAEAIGAEAGLSMSAIKSPAALSAAVVLELGDRGLIDKNSEMYSVYQAIKAGKSTIRIGDNEVSIMNMLDPEGLRAMAARSGISSDLIETMLSSPAAVEHQLDRTVDTVRGLQREELKAMIGRVSRGVFFGTGLDDRRIDELNDMLVNELFTMSTEVFADPDKRLQALAGALEKEGLDRSQAREIAMKFIARSEEFYKSQFGRQMEGMRGLFTEEVGDAYGKRMSQVQVEKDLAKLFAGIGKKEVFVRAADILRRERTTPTGEARPITFEEAAAEMLGSAATDELNAKMAKKLEELEKSIEEYKGPDIAKERRAELESKIKKLVSELEQFKPNVDKADSEKAAKAKEERDKFKKSIEEFFDTEDGKKMDQGGKKGGESKKDDAVQQGQHGADTSQIHSRPQLTIKGELIIKNMQSAIIEAVSSSGGLPVTTS